MIKLILDSPVYTVKYSQKIIRVICAINITIKDTRTKQVFAKQTVSGVAKCGPEDYFDEMFGRQLSFSRAKSAAHSYCMDFALEKAEDSLLWITFIATQYRYWMIEQNHENFLFNGVNIYDYEIPELREMILANVEARLPLLRGEDNDKESVENNDNCKFDPDYHFV